MARCVNVKHNSCGYSYKASTRRIYIRERKNSNARQAATTYTLFKWIVIRSEYLYILTRVLLSLRTHKQSRHAVPSSSQVSRRILYIYAPANGVYSSMANKVYYMFAETSTPVVAAAAGDLERALKSGAL